MNPFASNEKIQQLEQRHVQLIDELDALNDRLEQALNSFAKSSEPCVTAWVSKTEFAGSS